MVELRPNSSHKRFLTVHRSCKRASSQAFSGQQLRLPQPASASAWRAGTQQRVWSWRFGEGRLSPKVEIAHLHNIKRVSSKCSHHA